MVLCTVKVKSRRDNRARGRGREGERSGFLYGKSEV